MTLTKVVALSGGVGGARFLDGLAQALPPGALTAIVNTGDDFEHLGLYVCPDLDTVMYTLAGLGDEARGWGLAGETFGAMEMVRRYNGPSWFGLGDRDLATHLIRTEGLRRGVSLTAITLRLCERLGVPARVLPMADGPCRTMIETEGEGTLSFQDWFVRRRTEPPVRAVRFEGRPAPTPEVLRSVAEAELALIGPSNPYVSIDPILSLEGVRTALGGKRVIAVSPIVGGKAIKGPLATMIPQLAHVPASAEAILSHYRGMLAGIVVERGDEIGLDGLQVLTADTVMRSRSDRVRLAREVIAFAEGMTS